MTGKAIPDTIYLMGGPNRQDGDFQNDLIPTLPDNEGWLPPYLAEPPLWHIDTVNAELLDPGQTENHAMWCGKYYPPLWGEEVANPGYGNNLNEWLEWTGTVGDSGLPTEVRLTAVLNHDMEVAYDFLYFEVAGATGYTWVQNYNGNNLVGGVFTPVNVDLAFTLDPADYQGPGGDEIHLRWRFRSDGGFSDQDILATVGAAQIDNIAVSFDQGGGSVLQTFDDFEAGSPVHWRATRANNCGYAKVWPRLDDAGFCQPGNSTPRLAFIDDGTQCDDMPSFGTEITYGPDGMVVVPVEEGWVFIDEFWSPVMALPATGADTKVVVELDAYLDYASGYVRVRTSEDGGVSWGFWSSINSGLANTEGWRFISGRPSRSRISVEFQNRVDEEDDLIQIGLGVYKGGSSLIDSPTPYFDNVAVKIFSTSRPVFALGRDIHDNFPTNGEVNTSDLAVNDIRLTPFSLWVSLPRDGSVLTGPPEMHWILDANPLFDPYRTNLPPNPIPGTFETDLGPHRNGFPTSSYQFSFPERGFLFPGDELRFYYRVQDDAAGDIVTSTEPADTTGFSTLDEGETGTAGRYPQRFRIRGLPTLSAADPDSQPKILVWDASTDATETDDLMLSLAQLGYRPGRDYDLLRSFYFGLSNQGGRKTGHFGYTTIIAARDDSKYSHDQNIDTWVELGGRNFLLVGSNIGTASSGGSSLPENLTGAAMEQHLVRPYIDDQALPGLAATAAVPGINVPLVADACDYTGFDALGLRGTGQALYEFTAPGGAPGGYPYPAAIYNHVVADDARVITVPIAFSRLVSPDHFGGGLPARTVFLDQVLTFFGHSGPHAPSPVPTALGEFTVQAYPNPFNPRTTIAFNLPRNSAVDLHIYDLAGRRVKTLVNGEELPAGANSAVWTGRDEQDRSVAAGVYFYRLKAGQHMAVRRVTLIK